MPILGGSEKSSRTVTTILLLCVMMLGSLLCIAEPEDIEYGTLTVSPGEYKDISFGACEVGDLLLWELNVDTLSTTFLLELIGPNYDWKLRPSLTHSFQLYEEHAGEWFLRLSIDESDVWSATVMYLMAVTKPYVTITDPVNGSIVNQTTVAVSGHVDYWFDEVRVSLDQADSEAADLHNQHWNMEVTLTGEGVHTIHVEAFIHWGDYTRMVHDTATVTLDTQPPSISIEKPADHELVRDNHLVIQWTSNDDNGIASMEMNVDGEGWIALLSFEAKECSFSTGEHTVVIRATDTAGNQATDSVTFTVDARALSLDGPYYGIPLFGIILGAVLVAVALVFWLRKRRRTWKRVVESYRTEPDSP